MICSSENCDELAVAVMMAPVLRPMAVSNKKLAVINLHLVRWMCTRHYDEIAITFGSEIRGKTDSNVAFLTLKEFEIWRVLTS